MLITKFNRMIRNKVLWGIFGFIVVISFVGFFTPSSRSNRPTHENSAGKVNGKDVSPSELRQAKFHTYLSVSLAMGRPVSMTPEMNEEMRQEAWSRIAALAAAKQSGITASDREVASTIQRDSMFVVDGAFSKPRYDAFVKGFLDKMNVTAPQFEEFVREQIILQKVNHMIGTAVWIPPTELQEALRRYTDLFTVQYVQLSTNDFSKVKATSEEAKAFYEANTNLFIIPEQVTVKYVKFPVTDFATNIEVTEDEVTNYYSEHIEEFTVTDTNDLATAIPVEEVHNEIETDLAWAAAENRAREKATAMVDSLVPDRTGKAAKFEVAASNLHLRIDVTKPFSIHDRVDGLMAGPSFNKAAFDLRGTPEEYFSDPIAGADAVYVIAFNTRDDSRVPEFEEVRAKAMEYATEEARQRALVKKANEARTAMETALAAGESFAQAAKAQGLKAVTNAPFTAYDAPEALAAVPVLTGILARDKGELTDPLLTDGGATIAYIASRKAGDDTSMESLKAQLVPGLSRRRGHTLFKEWEDSLLTGAVIPETNLVLDAGEQPVKGRSAPRPDPLESDW